MSEYVLEMTGVCKSFPGVKALDHAQLKLHPGKVHALMGENGAGKSTLMKCMFGIYKMDEGQIKIDGQPVTIQDPMDALKKGIAMVHQELQPIPARTVGENIFMGRYPMKKFLGFIPMIDHDKMYADTAKLLKKVRMNFDPRQKVGELSVSQMQSVEIAKAVSANCRVLILDEPTSSLTQNEVEALFRIIEDLKAENVAIVYISHKMDEILRIGDEVTIMRNGQYIGTWEAKDLTTDKIITQMVGRELTNLYPPRENVVGEEILRVENFTSINPKSFRNVSFTLHKGEILGVGGLVGAQRTELMEGLFGIRSHEQGTIYYKGKELKVDRPKDAIDNGVALLTEDRRGSGIMGVLSVADNISVSSLQKYLDFGISINSKKVENLVQDNVHKMNIKTPSSKTLIKTLSGGNQQKVLLAKWILLNPKVLIIDEPTRGVDIGAKSDIYAILRKLASQGMAIIVVSSEIPEVMGVCDTIYVMKEGCITAVMPSDEVTEEKIGYYSTIGDEAQ